MWFPIIKALFLLNPNVFSDEITLIVPSYRGLFETKNAEAMFHKQVIITTSTCISDVIAIKDDLKLNHFDIILGWSTGAQIAINACAIHTSLTKRLILLNPSVGYTLHTGLQPYIKLPDTIGRIISMVIKNGINSLKPLIKTNVWVILKDVANSFLFRLFLESLAFFGGYPPEQPVYFHDYMKDVFSSRCHTRSLFDLILSLDEPLLTEKALSLPYPSLIIAGLPDFLTGIYHSYRLVRDMPNAKLIVFTMGSHWLLIEWPKLIAEKILVFITK
eukprot:gene12966-17387_t